MKRFREVLVILLLGITVQQFGADQPAEFPGKTPARSPDGRFEIRFRRGDPVHSIPHRLFLANLRSGVSCPLFSFEGSTEVRWSPDGGHVAINDIAGSNVEEAWIFEPRCGGKPLDVQAALMTNRLLSEKLARNFHLYFSVLAWRNGGHFRIRVWGHGDESPKGFTNEYEMDLSGHGKLLAEKSGEPAG